MLMHYAGFSSAAERWAANGPGRTGAYSGTLIITEIGDLATGLAEPNSTEGAVSYQAFFNFAVAARAKGCKLMLVYPPHSPEGVNLDQDTLGKLWRLVLWLRARPETAGLGVYLLQRRSSCARDRHGGAGIDLRRRAAPARFGLSGAGQPDQRRAGADDPHGADRRTGRGRSGMGCGDACVGRGRMAAGARPCLHRPRRAGSDRSLAHHRRPATRVDHAGVTGAF